MNSRHLHDFIYVASPFSGDIKGNVAKAKEYCRFVVDSGKMPIAPHLHYPRFMDDSDPDMRALGLKFGCALIWYCDEIWVFGETISNGMLTEIELAKVTNTIVRYFIQQPDKTFKEIFRESPNPEEEDTNHD